MELASVIHYCMLSGLDTIRMHPLSVMAEAAFKNLVQSRLIEEHPEIELEEASQSAGMATFISRKSGTLYTRTGPPTNNRLADGQSTDIRLVANGNNYSFEVKCRETFGSNAGLSKDLAGDIFRIENYEVDGAILAASVSSYHKLCRDPLTPGIRGRKPTHYYSDLLPPLESFDEKIRKFTSRQWHGADYVSIGAIAKCPSGGEDHVLLCITLFAFWKA